MIKMWAELYVRKPWNPFIKEFWEKKQTHQLFGYFLEIDTSFLGFMVTTRYRFEDDIEYENFTKDISEELKK